MSENANRIESIFAAAVALPSDQRITFLEAQCAESPQLRQQIEALLRAHDKANHLLDRPAAGANPTAIHTSQIQHPGELIAGRYKLLEQIGVGGMGAVWMAEQKEPVKRKVAIKLVKAGMDSQQVLARFEAERQALALMDHPNIAKVFDGGMTDQGRPYFVMEFVKGVPLTEYGNEARLSLKERLNLFIPVCQAVQHAHQKGIIHRDLKPSNILVCLYDGKPVPKVIDFGLAKAMHQSLTENTIHTAFGMMVGTPLYMSPEQAEHNNLDVDTRTDIYSLGVILYELLTGTTPLEQKQLKEAAYNEILRLIKEVEPPKPSTRLSGSASLPSIAAQRSIDPKQLGKSLTGDLDWIVMKSLDKERSRRYETANGLARDVERFLNDEAVEASPPSSSYRLKKLIRKHRTAINTAAVFAGVLILGTVVSAWLAIRATNAERDARQALVAEAKQRTLAETNERLADEQRIRAEVAAKKEAEQRTIAESARDRTRDVLDAMTSSATSDSLSTQQEISSGQKKFLTDVLTYYQEFAGENSEDERSRRRTAAAAFRVGTIEKRLGRNKEAIVAFEQAQKEYHKLAADFPAILDYRFESSQCQNILANLLMHAGNWTAAELQYREAMAARLVLVNDCPTSSTYRFEVAKSQSNLGNLLLKVNRNAEAEKYIRDSIDALKVLVESSPGHADYNIALWSASINLSILLDRQEKQLEADKLDHSIMASLEKLTLDFPEAPLFKEMLGRSNSNLGTRLRTHQRWSEAEAPYRKSLSVHEKLIDEYPALPAYKNRLAIDQGNLGMVLAKLGKTVDAEQYLRKAKSTSEKLINEFPATSEYHSPLASTEEQLAILMKGQDKIASAEEYYRSAVAHLERLVTEFPLDLKYQTDLGVIYCNLGQLARDSGRLSESLRLFDSALQQLSGAYEKSNSSARYRLKLRYGFQHRAIAFHKSRNYVAAINDWDKAIELSPIEERPNYRLARAETFLFADRTREIMTEIEELSTLSQWVAHEWYLLGCLNSVASSQVAEKKQEYADRAVKLLQRAVEATVKDDRSIDKVTFAKDHFLDPLRDREDFKKLLADLEKKKTPP